VAEAGAMMYMTPGIEMETVFGDASGQGQGGIMGALLGAGKRLLTGESLFMTVFTNRGPRRASRGLRGAVRRAHPVPRPRQARRGADLPEGLLPVRGQGRVHRDRVPEEIGVGLFGGEGFIMQRLQGDGLVFAHAGGMVHGLQLRRARRCAWTRAASSPCSRR
jgi:uncharacterized protein (AIM24 family)